MRLKTKRQERGPGGKGGPGGGAKGPHQRTTNRARMRKRRFPSARRAYFGKQKGGGRICRWSTLQILVFVFGLALVGLICFLGFLIVKFSVVPGAGSGTAGGISAAVLAGDPSDSAGGDNRGSRRSRGGVFLPPKGDENKPRRGVVHAKGKDTTTITKQNWPKQKVTLYSEPNCKGQQHVVHNTHIEQKCTKCFDVCAKKYDSGLDIQGHMGSLMVEGDRSVVSLWSVCKGTWKYPDDSGFITTAQSDEGCFNVNLDWPPVHLQFHFVDELQWALNGNDGTKTSKNKPNPYTTNPDTDPASVLKRISYWKTPESGAPKPATDKYVSFLKDCGGFNNIRMGFEYAVQMAWVTGRTLVLPPPEGWYLIDFGPITRGGQYSKGQTDYHEFFDIDHLKQGLPTISARQFYEREKDRLSLPPEFATEGSLESKNQNWKNFLFERFGGQPWSPLQKVVMWPSIKAYKSSANRNMDLAKQKTPVEFDSTLLASDVIHYPSCHGPNGDQGIYRFLGQIANSVLFADKTKERQFKQFWRDHIHYPKEVFAAAAHMIAKMGLFAYSAVHIRRNDLQYKESFQNAKQTLNNIEPLLYPGESLYISTDETNDGFFDAIREKHRIFQYKDVLDAAKGIPHSEKVVNIIEQTICAGGRRFFGTQKSTFTSYIFRIRGYIGAPDTKQYWHNIHYTGIDEVDAYAQPKVSGQNYMMEDPSMWEDIKEDAH